MSNIDRRKHILLAVGASSAASCGLFIARALRYQSLELWFLNWNLLLSWLPLLFAWLLVARLKNHRWLNWPSIAFTLLWLGFLPNSFYLASDLIHVQYSSSVTLLFDIVMLLSFTISGLMLGYLSLYMVHVQLLKRLAADTAHTIIAGVLLLCGFAIYIGRYLRWNTWDVLVNPAGLLFDVSDRLINPAAHEITFRTVAVFFILLASTYYSIWHFILALQIPKNKKS